MGILTGHLFTVFLTLQLFIASSAYAQEKCSKTFSATPGPQVETQFNSPMLTRTIGIESKLTGKHGGSLLELKRYGSQWLSSFSTITFDVQGDPRWFVAAMGETTAAFFGFKIIDKNTMIIPDAAELQGAIDKINTYLIAREHHPIHLTFVADDLTKTPMQSYLNRFMNSTLTFAASGHHLIHDISFHSGAIIIPNRLIDIAVKRVKFVLNFIDSITAREDLPIATDVKFIKKYIKVFLIRGIDNGTAFGNLFMIAEKAQDDSFTIGKINNLMSVIHNFSLTASQLSLSTAADLLFGIVASDVHFRDSQYTYRIPKKENEPFTLEEYALDMITQFLRIKYKDEEELTPYPAHRTSKARELLTAQMSLFKTQDQGKYHSLDLGKELAPTTGEFALSEERGVTLHEIDFLQLHSEFAARQLSIMDAVSALSR